MAAALESLLQCVICMDSLEKPKLLLCAHSFCRDCLVLLPKPGQTITCPSCRKPTPLTESGVDGLTDDFRMVQLKESLKVMSPVSKATAAKDCDVCVRSPASTCCLQCHKKMCPICLKRHNTHRNSSMHTIFRMEDLQICDKHGDYCGHVCNVCRRFVCVTCLMDGCSSHECRDVGEFARECLRPGNNQLLRMLDRVYFQVGKDQTETVHRIQQQIEQHCECMVTRLHQKRDGLLQELQHFKGVNRQRVESLEREDVSVARGVLEAYSGMGSGGGPLLLEGIPSSLLKLLPLIQAGTLPPGALAPPPQFQPKGFDIGELVMQNDPAGSSAGTSAGVPAPTSPDQAPAAAGMGVAQPAAPAPAPAPAPAAAAAQIPAADNLPRPNDWQDIEFSKVVRDVRSFHNGVIARFHNYIVRLDFMRENSIGVHIYERDTHRGYFDESDLLDRFHDVQNMTDYVTEIDFMKVKFFNYLNEENHPFQFDKIIHDRRRFMNALVAKAGNLVIRHDFNAENAVNAVFHPGDPSYREEEALINRFPRIDPVCYQEHVALMGQHILEYYSASRMDDDAASVSSTGDLFDGRQAPVSTYGTREEIYGPQTSDNEYHSASPRSMSPESATYWTQVYHNLRHQGYPESDDSDTD